MTNFFPALCGIALAKSLRSNIFGKFETEIENILQ
jgi:hypothetical protein